jgi:hypothetical protein
VLFEKRFWDGIADGSVTATFRRWKRPQVLPGRRYRTPGGIVEVSSVEVVDPGAITDADARAAGFAAAAEVVAALRGDESLPTYGIRFAIVREPDPRAVLAADDALRDEDVAAIDARLERLDKASSIGPWTMATLRLVGERPQVRAPDLAASVGRETAPFKLDVRKLKALGLTVSFAVGYDLSPRGRAYLARTTRR